MAELKGQLDLEWEGRLAQEHTASKEQSRVLHTTVTLLLVDQGQWYLVISLIKGVFLEEGHLLF